MSFLKLKTFNSIENSSFQILKNLWKNLGDTWSRFARSVAVILVGSYRTIGTLFFGGACRFQPSCSEYALEAFKTLPIKAAMKLVVVRVLKCRPGGDSGYDPVPEMNELNHRVDGV